MPDLNKTFAGVAASSAAWGWLHRKSSMKNRKSLCHCERTCPELSRRSEAISLHHSLFLVRHSIFTTTFAFLLVLLLIASPAYAKYGGGSGTEEDPYLIYTAEQMNEIGLNESDWGSHFKLMADIDLSGFTGTSFNIIGYYVSWDNNKPFTGVFDGSGHTISNFTYTSTGIRFIGLFGYVGGLIKDLGLIDPNVDAGTGYRVGSLVGSVELGTITNCYVEGGSVTGDHYVGGLVGGSIGGTITNCYVEGGSVSGTRWSVGGLVGYNGGTITNCYSEGDVSGNEYVGGLVGTNGFCYPGWGCFPGTVSHCYSIGSASGEHSVGGLVGYNTYDSTITNCYSEASASGNSSVGGLVAYNVGTITNSYATTSVSGKYLVGGLVGYNVRTITNCYSIGSVLGDDDVGGLVGENDATITICYAESDVSGHYSVGGLVGWNWGGSISNCYSEGGVTGEDDVGGLVGSNSKGTIIINSYSTGSSVSGSYCVGGLVGDNRETITNCYAEGGRVWGDWRVGGLVGDNYRGTITNSYATGSVTGNQDVGGLVGDNYYGTIANCYSEASVSGDDEVGGLVGENWRGTITYCYSTGSVSGNERVGGLVGGNEFYGKITNCYSEADVWGTTNVGGLVGLNPGTISNCYSRGVVSGNDNVGGLVGFNMFMVSTSFWDIQTSGQITSAGGTGKTTAEMQMMSTFTDAGWDFTTPVWTIGEGVDYPRLWWELMPVLHAEPEITLGTSNTITWDPVPGANDYYAECAEDANFTSIIYNTGWITETSYQFTDLELSQRYWYSVKARNAAGTETGWSNVESSLQATLTDAVDMMLDPDSLKNKNMKNALLNKINAVLKMLDKGRYEEALDKLRNDILQKTNGCAETGRPDKNDWIITCEGQSMVYPLVIETIEYVSGLMNQ